MAYTKTQLDNGKWVITEAGRDYKHPAKAITFAFDTETQIYFKGKVIDVKDLYKRTRNLNTEQKRNLLSNVTWAWQCYDEVNGFFMCNDFDTWLAYQCYCGYKFGWCYNSTFDFAQIDYEILGRKIHNWQPHVHEEKGYNKGQAWTYESLHSDMGARYAYKLWIPYRHKDRHTYVHAVEYRDFMKLITGGLAKLLKDLNVVDNEGTPIRKLTMDYQNVNTALDGLTEAEIDYCKNDVKGLYFAVKIFNETIEQNTNNELHIYGNSTNVMTAGGLAKHELLRSLYPKKNKKKGRVAQFKREHPLTMEQDKYLRDNHLYRGGISFVNPYYKGRLLTERKMYRYDVNSEYPFAMASIQDLVGRPFRKPLTEYMAMDPKEKEKYEAIYMLTYVSGKVKPNYIGIWYDPFKQDYVDVIDEHGLHLIYERELDEMQKWYNSFEFQCEEVILVKRGDKSYLPFVMKNYEEKANAKKNGNKVLQAFYKLLLNSSYGKLAERIERVKGHYELNEETGAIHFVRDEVEQCEATSMSVLVGALVTCVARCYILSKIREVCKGKIKQNFVYIDTDSIHCFCDYDKADAYTLGGLKLEAVCEAVKYIAPKTYVDIETVAKDGTVDYSALELHSKGINVQAVIKELQKKQKGKKKGLPTLALIDKKVDYGQQYICLCAMNVKGGKVLLPTAKYLAREELRPQSLVYTNYTGEGIFIEL